MISDPLFILGIGGMTVCLISWIRYNLNEEHSEPLVVKYISTISLISGIALLLSIFLNSGDLGIVLLAGSIIAFIVMLIGYYFKNAEIFSSARGYFIPILAIFILRTFLYEPYQIPSGSMEPQLAKGDFLLVNKYAYGLKVNRIGIPNIFKSEPQYGDAVVLIPPHNPVPYIKRLIGKPGDTIRIINKKLYINGEALQRSLIKTEDSVLSRRYKYSSGEIITREIDVIADLYIERHGQSEYIIRNIRGENEQYPQEWTVPKGHYFVMGDNRDNSNDSTKDVGFVPRENFFGKAEFIWMSWECWTCIPSFKKAGQID
ncbi:MAG: signal peptidase I [Gammaproteobacteria bacterium]|nr:signal peptidase I [Gammaproteobacteria bacterium]